ncbi:MAG TPA: class I tRNA ligase family protein, partial [Terriglobales bacterium]|nr:class I tRNA ligase family protein [Terriglobales bacterium]
DPIEITEKYGTDAVRFTLASMASPGTDIAFSESRTESYRAFANKIWNAARFIFMNVDRAEESRAWSRTGFTARADAAMPTPTKLEDQWILSRFNAASQGIASALGDYRFHEAAHIVYHFFWGEFCDWYIEIVKLRLNAGESEADKQTTASALDFVLPIFEASLRLLSPFMPFITEEIWHAIYQGKPPQKSIALSAYPQPQPAWTSQQAEAEMALLQALIVDVRTLRAEMKIEPKVKAPVEIHAKGTVQKSIEESRGFVQRMANIESISFVTGSLSNALAVRVAPQYEVRVVYEQKIDVTAERERLNKELKKLETEMANAERNLSNEAFLAKAPANVVEGIHRRKGELEMLLEKSRSALAQLGT